MEIFCFSNIFFGGHAQHLSSNPPDLAWKDTLSVQRSIGGKERRWKGHCIFFPPLSYQNLSHSDEKSLEKWCDAFHNQVQELCFFYKGGQRKQSMEQASMWIYNQSKKRKKHQCPNHNFPPKIHTLRARFSENYRFAKVLDFDICYLLPPTFGHIFKD